jgi:hypothetical protein
MAIKHLGNGNWEGLAADTKPVAAVTAIGTEYRATDTKQKWINDGVEWIAQDFPKIKKFSVYREGSKTYVIDIHKKLIGSATETEDAINPILAAQPNTTIYLWIFDNDVFTFFAPVIFPNHSAGVLKKNIFRSEAWSTLRSSTGGVTAVRADSTFPTNRYFFETVAGIGSNLTSEVEISGFQGLNVDNFATTNVGFVKLESDTPNNQNNWVIRDCYFNYLWRCVHLIGYIWYGLFQNLFATVSNVGFAGDSCFILEDGGHNNANNPTPKSNTFTNIQSNSGDGVYECFLHMKSGGYNLFERVFVDGKYYNTAVFYLNNTDTLTLHNNTFRDITTLDLETLAGTPHGSLYLGGTAVNDNYFEACRLSLYGAKMIKLEGTGVMNNYIQAAAYWGGNELVVAHFTNGESNTVEAIGGSKTTAGNLPITLTGTSTNRVKIIDKRRGAENKGTYTTSGDGVTKIINIPHGCFASPYAYALPSSDDARGSYKLTTTTTNIVLTYPVAPPSGGSNLVYHWRASVYD